MTAIELRERTLHALARQRRVTQRYPDDGDATAVRLALEEQVGATVSHRMAARFLGVSHTALRRWTSGGDLPLVPTVTGRLEVPVDALLDLRERAERARATGRKHALEVVAMQDRRRADALRTDNLTIGSRDAPRSDRRALAFHQALAPGLDHTDVAEARHLLHRWQLSGRIDPRYAERWATILLLPIDDLREVIVADTQTGRDLRQNSPFAGALSEAERRRLIELVG